MEGVRGYTWAVFEERAREIESLSGWPPSRKPLSPNAGRLCREDMAIYGEEPASDSLSLVVCGQCGRIVKPQGLLQHKKLYHTDMVKVPAPHAAPPHLGGVHTIGQSSSAVSTNSSSSGYHNTEGGVTGFTASQLPTTSSSGRSNKEYDPNKHCGVWINDDKRHCTHSLTCKEHPVSERRKVAGRGRSFDDLLEEHKKKKKMRKLEKLKSDADVYLNQTSHAHSPPLRSPTRSSRFDPTSPGSEGGGEAMRTSAPSTPSSKSDDLDAFPKPLAVCSFGGRSTLSGGALRFGRRQDSIRSALAHLSGRSQDYTQTTLHRKHSYNSLLKQKRTQRKYFNHQQQISEESTSQRPSSLPLPLHPVPLPPTPSHPSGLNSPLYASTILSDISSATPPTSLPLSVGSTNVQQPLPDHQAPPVHTPVVTTPQTTTPSLIMTPESVLNSHLANGDISRDSMETDLETPLSVPPTSETPVAHVTAQTNRRPGKKKKKRGRKSKDKGQVESSSAVVAQGVPDSVVSAQQQLAEQNSRTPVAAQGGGGGGGGVMSGAYGHPLVHSGDDMLRTSREQMEFENRRSIGSSSSISSLTPSNPHVLSNSFSSSQAQPIPESGQTRLTTDHRAPSTAGGAVGVHGGGGGTDVSTPPRDSSIASLPLSIGGMVRVKQEPITNHEEEMEMSHPPPVPVAQHQRQPTTKPQSVVLNGMVTPQTGPASPSLHHGFGSQTFVINPTGQHSSPGGHPLMTSLSTHLGGLLPIRPGSTLFSTSPGLLATHQQLQMMQQRTLLLQQLHQQQQQQQQQHHIMQGAPLSSPPQSSVSLASNVITSRTNANPMQNSITTGGGLVMTASGHGFQPSFHVGGSESLLKSSSSGSNRIRAPISHIPSANPPFQKRSLLQGKQSLNSGTSTPRHRSSHNHNEEIT